LTASTLVVAGGGGGGSFGGGGAGGYRTGSSITLDTNSIYLVTVGAGGASNGTTYDVRGNDGSNSVFNAITSTGGGGGGQANSANPGRNGGSGGGGGYGVLGGADSQGGSGNTPSTSPSQGNNGGFGQNDNSLKYVGGGGGGAGAVGGNASQSANTAGNGGNGTASSISGASVTYAGGGGGGRYNTAGTSGTGGSGGGGNGGNWAGSTSSSVQGGSDGTANTGGGGGCRYAGGSGIVIISYPGSTQQMAGGTVTVAGGNVIHTFTSSGYLTPIVLVNNSLRFRSSASAYLNRTPTTAGNRKTWTWSGWVKRGALANGVLLGTETVSAQTYCTIYYVSDKIYLDAAASNVETMRVYTNAVFRDPSAWYHVVAVLDTTQATASNRTAIYVNGVQQTLTVSTNPAQNLEPLINSTVAHNIGRNPLNGIYFDGYMADINFVDGQALTPNSFGTSNGLGVWQPIRYGGSYGTNGFYLPFNAGTSSFAGSFNGSSQYLTIAQNAAFNMGSGDFTIESWVYFNASGRAAIISQTNSAGTNTSTSFYLERTASNFLRILVASGGTSYEVTGTTIVPSGQWIHVAGVRNGNNLSCYLNGVLQGTVSVTGVSLNSSTENVQINGYGTSTALVFAGAMSNTRIVKGTAVYTSNFTPPTANLTAISGTSLLTLQNATIVDNSTNAFSITNTGTVTTGQTYPFAYAIFNDQGPAGNNWTPNNFSGASGSTLDYMTDVPTLTSATVANYCTLNPINSYATALSNGNLKFADGSGNAYQAYGTIANPDITALSFYCEVTVDATYGVAIAPSTKQGSNSNTDRTGVLAYYSNGNKFNGTSSSSYGASFTSGDVIGIAMGGGAVTFYKNGVSQGVAFSGLTGSYMFGVWSAGSAGIGCSFNFGQRPFAYTPPTNFVALNTFNLPTPTIGATASTTANKYFDALLYTGNGSASQRTDISWANMQPDMVWIKNRTSANNHVLHDDVRGTNAALQPNLTNATDSPVGFGTDGFGFDGVSNQLRIFTSDGRYNTNGNAYVTWGWKGSGATGVTNTAGSITSTVSANTTAGFSIATWTGQTSGSATIGHGLGVAPSVVLVKGRNDAGQWWMYHSAMGNTQYIWLNNSSGSQTGSGTNAFANTAPTSTVFTVGTSFASASPIVNWVAYCFAQVAGYSAFGSYTGNGSADGPFVYTGFRPKYVLIKVSSTTENWKVLDSSRDTYNVVGNELFPNLSNAESTGNSDSDFLSNGFKLRATYANINSSGATYIYMAFAENPFKYSNAR